MSSASSSAPSVAGDFLKFRNAYPLKKAAIARTEDVWQYYESGPPDATEALVFIHGTSGTAGVFFYQLDALGTKGFRVISAQYAPYYKAQDWCKGFDFFLDILKVQKVHLFGTALGGFLCQHYASMYPRRVRSLILCNSFCSTRIFSESAPFIAMVHITPTVILRNFVLNSFPQGFMELKVQQASDWVSQEVAEMDGTDLAARLSLNCNPSVVGSLSLDETAITLMETNDKTMVPNESRLEQRQRYHGAKVAMLKTGGDFPFLSRPDEVTLFIEVHMRNNNVFPDRDTRGVMATDSVASAQAVSHAAGGYSQSSQPAAAAAYAQPTPFEDSVAPVQPQEKKQWVNPFEEDDLL